MSYVTLQWNEPWHVQTQKTHTYKLKLLHFASAPAHDRYVTGDLSACLVTAQIMRHDPRSGGIMGYPRLAWLHLDSGSLRMA